MGLFGRLEVLPESRKVVGSPLKVMNFRCRRAAKRHGAVGEGRYFFRCWFGHFFGWFWWLFFWGWEVFFWVENETEHFISLVSIIFFLAILNVHYDTSTNPHHSYVPSENILGSTKRPYQGTWLVATTGCSSLWGLSSYKLVEHMRPSWSWYQTLV